MKWKIILDSIIKFPFKLIGGDGDVLDDSAQAKKGALHIMKA